MGLIHLDGVLAKGVRCLEGSTRIGCVAVEGSAVVGTVKPLFTEAFINPNVVLIAVAVGGVPVVSTIEDGCAAGQIEGRRRTTDGIALGVDRVNRCGCLGDLNIPRRCLPDRLLSSFVPTVFGKAVAAQAAKAGSLNVMFELTAFEAR